MARQNSPDPDGPPDGIAFIGFGEAASAFRSGWRQLFPALAIGAYDIKTDDPSEAVRAAKWADYEAAGIDGRASPGEALAETAAVFSLVSADQSLAAATGAASAIAPGTFYFDCNSCAPGTKRKAARLIDGAGGRYVDVAVMAPVHPQLHRTPLLVGGPHAGAALPVLGRLDMDAKLVPGEVGTASAIKMTRSIMIKGLEALVLECVLAGRKAGIDAAVLDSLDASFPGFDWKKRAAYMLERVVTHGIRRAAEMREVALTVEGLDLEAAMSAATAGWQQRIGDLALSSEKIGAGDYRRLADAILDAIATAQPASAGSPRR